ncbi:MAG: T9SS type A sorting domain-containing protein [Ignavibacteriaceae bacterium]|jgi:hypothetical protein
MGTKVFLLAFTVFQVFTLFLASAQITAHGEFSFDVVSSNSEAKTLTAGYDSRATNGIDTSFGEEALPPYTQNQFDARFRLPDSITTTYRDFRVGCNFYAKATYIVEWVNSQSVKITSNHLSNFVTYVKFINIADETVLAEFLSPDSIYFQAPLPLNQIKISVLYVMALSFPRSNLYSPQSGEVLHADSVVDIKFNFWYGSPAQNDLFFSTDSGASWKFIGTTPNRFDTSYAWTVPSINSNKCKIRVGDYPCYYAENSGTFSISTTVPVEVNLAAEKSFNLSQNYPNPFNPVTTINYSVAELGLVNISVFDILGRNVRTLINTLQNAGDYSIPFDASKLSGGIYYYRLTTNGNLITRKMILLK